MTKNVTIIEDDQNLGVYCPKCGNVAEIREHTVITEKELKKPYYYKRWYNCRVKKCKVTIFFNGMKDAVYNRPYRKETPLQEGSLFSL